MDHRGNHKEMVEIIAGKIGTLTRRIMTKEISTSTNFKCKIPQL